MYSTNSSRRPARRSLRVLIVDDEHTLADSLAMIVQYSGHDSLAVYTGREAVNAMQTFHPDVVLSDVMMPGMNGFELVGHLAEHFPDCKVLLMSGAHSAVEIAEEHTTRGRFMNVLPKPVLPQTILKFVASCAEAPAMG